MVRCRAVTIPGGDATGQYALDGVDLFEDLGTHATSFQSLLRGKMFCRALFTIVLVCLDHDRLLMMWTPRKLTLDSLHYSPIDVNGARLFL
jgi:hypothetical protein